MAPMFVVLDGVDGCGKSTQAELLVASLGAGLSEGMQPLHLREPGSTALGERVRGLLLDRDLEMSAEVETLLFAAARRQMLDELVRPALAAGRDVICERFHPSTFAYQAVAGELEGGAVMQLLRGWADRPAPDLIVLFELDVDSALARRGAASDRIEDKGADYLRAVARGYQKYAEMDSTARIVDAGRERSEVAVNVLELVMAMKEQLA